MNLYKRIEQLCKEKGMPITAMCSKAGVCPSIVYDIKSGRKKGLSRSSAEKIAFALDVSIDALYNDDPTKVEETQDELLKKRKVLFDLSSKATEEDLDRFIKMLNAIVGD